MRNSGMKIKVCGMRERDNILQLLELKPDYMGLIFYPGSARYVADIDSDLLGYLSKDIMLTGVFVNESQETIFRKVRQYRLKAIQLHGDETPEFCHSLNNLFSRNGIDVQLIKAFGIDERFQFNVLEAYLQAVNYFLFDTKSVSYGGAGVKFNWEILEKYHLDVPYFLSGGITLNDLPELALQRDERLYAIDINSKFETAPAVKDMGQVQKAIQILRNNEGGTFTSTKI